MLDQHVAEEQCFEERVSPPAGLARTAARDRRGPTAGRRGDVCFRLLAESLEGCASFVLDARGRVAEWNVGAERLLGYRPEEVLGKSFTRFFPTEDVWRGAPERELEAAVEARFEGDGERVRKDGSRFAARVVVAALDDEFGARDGFLVVLRELPAAAELGPAPRTGALDLLPEGVFLTDAARPENPIVYANAAFIRLTGLPADEISGHPYGPRRGAAGDAAVPAELRAAFRDRQPWEGELTAAREDGGPAWHRLRLTPVTDAAGQITHFVGIQTDVTERKYFEEWFRQAQKMTAVGWLAAGVVHDFNNLLTAILGYCDILLKEPLPEGAVRDGLQEILRGSEWGAALTRQLLAFCRSQAPQPRVLDLREVLGAAAGMLRRLVGENIEMDTVLDAGLSPVLADATQIEQVLVNLVVNARDALPEGGRITVEATDVEIDAGTVPPGTYVRLAVTDTGCGMTEEVRAALFRPLFTTKERGKGTGLGLYTVQQIVQQSRGHITVTSAPGRGTRFEVYLPRHEGDAESGARPAPEPKR